MRILKIEYVLLLNKLCPVKTSHRSQMIPKELLYNTAFSAQLPITMSSQTPLLKYFSFSRSLYPTTLTLSSMKGVCAAIKCTSGKQSSSHISIQWRRLLITILVYIMLLNSAWKHINMKIKRICQLKASLCLLENL